MVRWRTATTATTARTVRSEPGFREIAWSTPHPATLVVAETWDRGWRAAVDGRAVPVVPIEGALLGVELGPGEGRLTLSYRPPGLVAGALLSFSVLAVLAVLAVLGGRWK